MMTTDQNKQEIGSNINWVIFTALSALLITLNIALTFQLSEQSRVEREGAALTETDIRKGAATFIAYCADCHGGDGKGTDNAPVLNDKEFLSAVSDNFLSNTIADGRARTAMPAWGQDEGGLLTTQQIDQVVAFLRNWEKPVIEVGRTVTASGLQSDSIEGGQETFIWYCAECHGDDGELPAGSEDIIANSPLRLLESTEEDTRTQILDGGEEMPGLLGLLSVSEVDGLIKYMNTWSR